MRDSLLLYYIHPDIKRSDRISLIEDLLGEEEYTKLIKETHAYIDLNKGIIYCPICGQERGKNPSGLCKSCAMKMYVKKKKLQRKSGG